jgi:tRNA uridine 5-carboxymethylaminomethyl modification enzyme
LRAAREAANAVSVTPNEAQHFGITLNRDGQRRTAFDLLSYASITRDQVAKVWPGMNALAPAIAEQLEIDAKYSVYLERQREDAERFRRDEALGLPETMDFEAIPGLSIELRAKLKTVRPRTLGHANRIEGMTPAALGLLALHARRKAG